MKNLSSKELRTEFLNFFKERGHKVVASSSLVPADPTSLFTSAGMQQFVPYFSGEHTLPYKRVCSAQKCVRVNDVEEVGDSTHHTFFEMLGNWSFGDYFKKKAIDMALEFLLTECGIEKSKLWVTVFTGQGSIPKDTESVDLWKSCGIPENKIFEYGFDDNFWGPVTKTGPCGPCSEIFFELTDRPCGPDCHPNCECGRFVEIWNLVFMEYNKTGDGKFEKLSQQNVDTGMGFERMLSLLQGKPSAYQTDLFLPIIQELERLSGCDYKQEIRRFRVIVDHIRASSFIIGDGVIPSNTGRGYVLRMLLRRMFRHAEHIGLSPDWFIQPIQLIGDIYGDEYNEVREKRVDILTIIQEEQEKFSKTLKKGLIRFNHLINGMKEGVIAGKEAFDLYQSYGFPLELIKEMAVEKGFKIDEKGFHAKMSEHKEVSKAGAEKKFGGVGIADLKNKEEREAAICLHTATHLLQSALMQVLGDHIKQMGSDISSVRLRFDFSHSQAITDSQIKKIEEIVNEKIKQGLNVEKQEMGYQEALESGALAFFKQKYPKIVNVYSIEDKEGDIASKEVCAGPHVKNTSELGHFKIIKQESVGAGIRRIKAILG